MLFGITLSLSLQTTISQVAIFNAPVSYWRGPSRPHPPKKETRPVSNLQRCECDLIGNRAFADTVKDPEVEIMDLEWTQWPVPL